MDGAIWRERWIGPGLSENGLNELTINKVIECSESAVCCLANGSGLLVWLSAGDDTISRSLYCT